MSNLFPPVVRGGYEVECAGVVERLRADHDVLVLTSSLGAERLPADPAVVRELPWLRPERRDALRAPRASIAAAAAARRAAERLRPELVYVWNGSGIPHSALRVLDGLGVPLAYRVCEHWFTRLYRGDQFMRHLAGRESGFARTGWAAGARLLNRAHPGLRLDPRRTAPASVSWVSAALRAASPAPPAVDVLHEEVLPPATPEVDAFAELARAPAAEPVLLYAGRLEPQKGPDVAVRALARLATEHGIDARLEVVGDGDRDALARLSGELGLGDRVGFHGRLEPGRLREVAARAHVWLVPSLWEEPAGMPCIEAALARVPIVAARIGGIPELVRDGEEGLLFTPGDDRDCARALAATLSRPEATAGRVERARARAEDRRFEPYLARTRAFLTSAVEAHRARYGAPASSEATASV